MRDKAQAAVRSLKLWQKKYLWVGVNLVFDRLDADIAHAMMSINAVKGVEIGDGFAVAEQFGHETRD